MDRDRGTAVAPPDPYGPLSAMAAGVPAVTAVKTAAAATADVAATTSAAAATVVTPGGRGGGGGGASGAGAVGGGSRGGTDTAAPSPKRGDAPEELVPAHGAFFFALGCGSALIVTLVAVTSALAYKRTNKSLLRSKSKESLQ